MGDQGTNAGGEYAAPEAGGALALAVGLACFGFALGFTTAISQHEGISAQLLSGLFSFVGGSILTYGGFRYARRREGSTSVALSPRRVGLGLVGFSIGVLLGQPAGLRYSSWEGARIARSELDECVKRAEHASGDYKAHLVAWCWGVTLAAPATDGENPAARASKDKSVTPMAAAAGRGTRSPADRNRPRKDAAAATTSPQPDVKVSDPPTGHRALTHGSDVEIVSSAKEDCREYRKLLGPGGDWADENNALAKAFRKLLASLDCGAP